MNAQKIAILFLIFLSLGMTTVTVVPSLKNRVKSLFSFDGRRILAKVIGKLGNEGPEVTVLKIEEDEQLYIEIYTEDSSSGQPSLLSKIRLDETRDAHFTYQGNATNLALGDMDGDGIIEIFVPTFDDQMVARLNIYKYNTELRAFERISSKQTNEVPR